MVTAAEVRQAYGLPSEQEMMYQEIVYWRSQHGNPPEGAVPALDEFRKVFPTSRAFIDACLAANMNERSEEDAAEFGG